MQLPRGTFREIKKGKKLGDILTELEHSRFSGVCSISFTDTTGTLVMKSGKCILAEYAKFAGDAAYEELEGMPDREVDAALSTLTEAQIQLSLEFNKPARIIKTGKTFPGHRKTVEPSVKVVRPTKENVHQPTPAPRIHTPSHAMPGNPPRPVVTSTVNTHAPVVAPTGEPVPVRQHTKLTYEPAPMVPKAQKKPILEKEQEKINPELSSFETDIETFDAMDINSVTDKIRNDCKTMVRQLHLDHLMER